MKTTRYQTPRDNVQFILSLLRSALHTLEASGVRDHYAEFLRNKLSNTMLDLNEGKVGHIMWDRTDSVDLPHKSGPPNLKNREGVVFDSSFINLANAFRQSSSVQTKVFGYLSCYPEISVREAFCFFGDCSTICLSLKQIIHFTIRHQDRLSKTSNNYFIVCLPDKTRYLVTVAFVNEKFNMRSHKLDICKMKHLQAENVKFFLRLDPVQKPHSW